MRYWDLIIGSIDQGYIDSISEIYNVDYYDAEIYPEHQPICNQIIYYIFTEAINNLNVSDDTKEYLISKIYCNAYCSWIDLQSEDVDDMIDWTDDEKEIVKEFLSL